VSAEWLLQTCYDTSNGVIYVATTTGAAGTAVWEAVLEVSQLAANGGSIPELDRTNAFTEQQLVPGGDQASPSWSFDGDQDTGMYSPSPDVIRFAVGGSAHWDFQDDGSLVFTGGGKVGADNINAKILYEDSTRVVQSGSNSDGYWVRYSDGTQIISKGDSTSSSSDKTWTFPKSFNTSNGLHLGVGPTTGFSGVLTAFFRNSGSTTQEDFVGYDANGRKAATVSLFGFGQWT
jgi:hypothetical protein